MELVLMLIGAYLIGSIPNAFILAKVFYGIDIRKHGTGNIGASNVLKLTSKWLAVLVTILDIAKGAVSVWIAREVGLDAAAQVTAGIFAIIGHNWPIFLKFHGGKGVFTSLGVIGMITFKLGLIVLITPYLFFAPFRQLALGVFVVLVLLPILSWFGADILNVSEPLPATIGFIFLSSIAFFKRLIGPRSELSKSVSNAELLLNRLFFDRDIKDRKKWISQNGAD